MIVWSSIIQYSGNDRKTLEKSETIVKTVNNFEKLMLSAICFGKTIGNIDWYY